LQEKAQKAAAAKALLDHQHEVAEAKAAKQRDDFEKAVIL